MTGWVEDLGLRFEGLDDNDIAALNARLLDIENLLLVLEKNWPIVNRVLPAALPPIAAALNEQIPDIANLLLVIHSHVPQINRVLTVLLPIIRKIIANQRSLPQ